MAREGEIALFFGGACGGRRGWLEIEAEDVAGLLAGGADGDGFDFGVDEVIAAAVAPDAVLDLFVDLDDVGRGARFEVPFVIERGLEELAVVGGLAAGKELGLIE